VSVVCGQVERSVRRTDSSSRGVVLCVVCLSVNSKPQYGVGHGCRSAAAPHEDKCCVCLLKLCDSVIVK
jgi:hypothetical protein